MKVLRAAFYRGQLHYDANVVPIGDPIYSISRADFPAPHDFAVTADWMVEKEAEDHPMMGCLIYLGRPDGSDALLASVVMGAWARFGGSAPIQALEFTMPGRYFVEITPGILTGDTPRGVTTTRTGEHRLATLALEVS